MKMSAYEKLSIIQRINLVYWICLPVLAGAFVRVSHLDWIGALPEGAYWLQFGIGILYGVAASVLNVTPVYFIFLVNLRGPRVIHVLPTYIVGTCLVGGCTFLVWRSEHWESDLAGYIGFVLMGLSIGVSRLVYSAPEDE
ncbi:MAG: hypothetical protein AAF269_07925 [Pseudomonadota bacterium]